MPAKRPPCAHCGAASAPVHQLLTGEVIPPDGAGMPARTLAPAWVHVCERCAVEWLPGRLALRTYLVTVLPSTDPTSALEEEIRAVLTEAYQAGCYLYGGPREETPPPTGIDTLAARLHAALAVHGKGTVDVPQ